MPAELTKIDEKYTISIDDGHTRVLRHGEPWLGEQPGGFEGSKAWIAAAGAIDDLRQEVARLAALLAAANTRGC